MELIKELLQLVEESKLPDTMPEIIKCDGKTYKIVTPAKWKEAGGEGNHSSTDYRGVRNTTAKYGVMYKGPVLMLVTPEELKDCEVSGSVKVSK